MQKRNMKKLFSNKLFKTIFITLVVLVISYVGVMWYAYHPVKGTKYLFPEKYRGWVGVTYNAKNFPPLKKENGFLLVKIPKNGMVKTSSTPNTYSKEGYYIPTYDEHYYYSDKGIREAKELAMGGGFTVQKEGSDEFTSYFWISTKGNLKSDYDQYVKDVPKMDDNGIIEPVCGQWVKGEKNE